MDNLIGKKVFVYYNLHKKVWSVKDWKTKRVIAHVTNITLKNCTLKVSEKGRQRVLKERRKNVHAGVLGTITSPIENIEKDKRKELTYNPYKFDSFVYKLDGYKVHMLNCIYMDKKQLWEVKNEEIK